MRCCAPVDPTGLVGTCLTVQTVQNELVRTVVEDDHAELAEEGITEDIEGGVKSNPNGTGLNDRPAIISESKVPSLLLRRRCLASRSAVAGMSSLS
jgi:hypothetical protein